MLRSTAIASVLGVVAIAAAGCGGGTTSSGSGATTTVSKTAVPRGPLTQAARKHLYVSQMRVLGKQLARQLDAIGSASVSPTNVDAEYLRTAIPKLRTAAKKLERIVPPPDVRADHEALIRGVREFADELDKPIERLEKGDLNGFGDILALKGIRDMEAASAAIVAKGYPIVAK